MSSILIWTLLIGFIYVILLYLRDYSINKSFDRIGIVLLVTLGIFILIYSPNLFFTLII